MNSKHAISFQTFNFFQLLVEQNQHQISVCYQAGQGRVVLAFHDIITMQNKKDVSYLHMEAVVGTKTISEIKQVVNDDAVSAAERLLIHMTTSGSVQYMASN